MSRCCWPRPWRNQAGPDGELAKIKEQELEAVRERISALKKSMDASAAERDRLTGELQELEIAISEQRASLAEIEGQQRDATDKKRRLDDDLDVARRTAPGRSRRAGARSCVLPT